jgi:hypothetical protein
VPPQLQKDREDDFEMWPEHWDAWQVFLSCATQWRILVGLGGMRYQGLDYIGVESVMRFKGIKDEDREEVFAHLQVLEEEALKVINGKSSG